MSHECLGDIIRRRIDREVHITARHQRGAASLLLTRLEEHRVRLFERSDGELRYGDDGVVTISLTNAEARAILGSAWGGPR